MIELLSYTIELGILRNLDLHFAKLLAHKNEPARLLVAAYLSASSGNGNVCLPLSQLNYDTIFKGRYPELAKKIWQKAKEPSNNWHDILNGWTAISTKYRIAPIVLIKDKLYLHRLWDNEGKVVRFFQKNNIPQSFNKDQIRIILNRLFTTQDEYYQKIAAAIALTRKITVISGGPGTGKTTTVSKILAALICLSNNVLRIQLAAPTGKAAIRLTESIVQNFHSSSLIKNHKNKYILNQAITMHRLLGVHSENQSFKYNLDNQLHLDVLVVDEASMIDLSMMVNLINALPQHARIIFLGDRDQLSSVESGSVLGDICQCAEEGYSTTQALQLSKLTGYKITNTKNDNLPKHILRNSICLLHKSYRFNEKSGIGILARTVNTGKIKELQVIFNQSNFTDIKFHTLDDNKSYYTMINEIIKYYQPFLQLLKKVNSPIEKIVSFSHYQVLCVLRDGPFGIGSLNKNLEKKMLQMELIKYPDNNNQWYHGKPIMVTRNDSILGLFNGDIGITLYNHHGLLKVFFLMSDNTLKEVHPSNLPQHDTAWAITVHKSQGSEFYHTALIIPTHFLPILTRELIYTAITRAKKKLTIYSKYDIFYQAVQNHTQRWSGLVERLTKEENT